MKLAIDELQKSRRYHARQIEENYIDIKNKEAAIQLLKNSIKKHEETVDEIDKLIQLAEKTE